MDAPGTVSPIARLDEVARFARPRMWLALLSVLLLLAAFAAWLVLARAPVTTPVSGVLTSSTGLIATGDGPVIAVALVPVSQAGAIKVGQQARIAPSSAPVAEFGYLVGTVSSTGDLPVTPQRLEELTGSIAGLSGSLVGDEPIVEVRIALAEDPATASGLRWTLGEGPPFTLLPGTVFTGEIIQGSTSPFARLFG
jgi:hypothetical protein